eukprot:3844365-Rhodomonas_salina.3
MQGQYWCEQHHTCMRQYQHEHLQVTRRQYQTSRSRRAARGRSGRTNAATAHRTIPVTIPSANCTENNLLVFDFGG